MTAEKLIPRGWKPPRVEHDPAGDKAALDRELELLEMKRWDYCRHTAQMPVRVARFLAEGKPDLQHHPLVATRQALDRDRRLVILHGPPGTGKSVAACAPLWEALSGHYVRADRYVQLARSFDHLDLKHADVFQTSDLLVLDDVGEEPAKERWLIERLLSERYDALRTTIVTTNFRPDQFGKAYGLRVMSRVGEVGDVIKCTTTIRPGAPRQGRLL